MAGYELVTKPATELSNDDFQCMREIAADCLAAADIGASTAAREAYAEQISAAQVADCRSSQRHELVSRQTCALLYDRRGALQGYAGFGSHVSSNLPGLLGRLSRTRRLESPRMVSRRELRVSIFVSPAIDPFEQEGKDFVHFVTAYDALFVAGATSKGFDDEQPLVAQVLDGHRWWNLALENWGLDQVSDGYPLTITPNEDWMVRRMTGRTRGQVLATILNKPDAPFQLGYVFGVPVPDGYIKKDGEKDKKTEKS